MKLISETYKQRLQVLAGLKSLEEAINFTNKDLTQAYDKSWQRVAGFDIALIKQAISEGRALGVSYKSSDMPVTKFRIILPVTIGIYNTKSGTKMKVSGFHLAGQSEKAAQGSGKRSQETSNVWRLFDLDAAKFKGMWLTDKFFYEYPPGYKKGDKRFISVEEEYDTGRAQLHQIEREEKGQKEAEPIDLRGVEPQGPTPAEAPENREEVPITAAPTPTGAETEDLYEKEINPLYAKKPWLKYLRPGNGFK